MSYVWTAVITALVIFALVVKYDTEITSNLKEFKDEVLAFFDRIEKILIGIRDAVEKNK